jgi:Tfp pilus assembly protein PilF
MGGAALISREICQMQGDQALAADDINAALGHYDRAILFDPSNAQALMNRAGIYEQTGQIERAIADYRRVAALSSAPAILSQQAADRLKVLGAANP